jgi:WD40 repeat protein
VFDISDEAKIQQLQMFHVGPDLSSSTFSPDGSFLAVLDKTALHIIQTKPWRRLTQKDLVGEFYDASFSPDSRTLIALGEKKIHRFDTAMWQEKRPAMSVPSYRPTWQFSPDGRWLATYEEVHHGHGHTLGYRRVVWNLATGLKTAWKETDTIGYKAESPEGGSQNLIADSNRWRAGSDKSLSTDSTLSFNLDPYSSTLMLQDVDSKRTIAKLEHDGDVTDAAFSPHGRWLATSSKDGTVRLWPLQVKEMLEQACKLLPRNITPEEWTQFHMDGPYRKACPNLR